MSPFAQKQSSIRPRVLTVDRKQVDKTQLRVLRRLTYTEEDPVSQHEKLLFAYDVADWGEEFFNNRALFSDYYLKERLQVAPEWKEDPKPAFQSILNLYQDAPAAFRNQKEDVVREKLFEPMFEALGFGFKAGKGAGSGVDQHDYLLHAPGDGKKPLALCLTYPWARSLDGKDYERDSESSDENPGALVVSLLERGAAPWAIVTNGKTWRLYAQRTHSRATNYYEIDLEELLAQDRMFSVDVAESFRYFWLLFRCEAFELKPTLVDGKEQDVSFLDGLLTGSEQYAKELGERLKDRVFLEIFPHLAEGFIAHIRQEQGTQVAIPQERLDEVFQGTLALLYRLLFVLYAEARDLLPVREQRGYHDISLARMKDEISRAGGTLDDERDDALNKRYACDGYTLYDRLTRVCKAIEEGDAAVNVPLYDGGLFLTKPHPDDTTLEARNARFLDGHKLPDRYFAKALDRLARDIDDKRHDLVMIDFKSLGVRQLGSIYEGLLEFRLRIAPEDMAIVQGKKTEEVIPHSEAQKAKRKILVRRKGDGGGERLLPKGTVYLENDKRERKATGSYYTPDHIVQYIIEHAVGPVLQERFDSLRGKLRDAEKRYRDFEKKQEALKKGGIKPEDPAKANLIGRELVDDLVGPRVLDPAMGSGHFLVEAVDFITDKTLDFLNGFSWNPVTARLEDMRTTILEEMQKQNVDIDRSKLTDVNLLKRLILKNCIYGVDLNPMAVELAKVSLWLDCFTLGAPLSFLDHHIKCGNSLIGVSVDDARTASETGQGLLWGNRWAGFTMAMEQMKQIGRLSDVTTAEAAESRKKFREASRDSQPFKLLCDVYASQWFGNEPYKTGRGGKKQTTNPALDLLHSEQLTDWLSDPDNTAVFTQEWECNAAATARQAAADKRFFHWELEFPEVFFTPRPGSAQAIERDPDAGFDAVVGNPPYVRQEGLGEDKPFFKDMHSEVYSGVADIYVYFYRQGLALARKGGRFGMITSNKYLRAGYGKKLREHLGSFAVAQVIDFRDLPVFEDAAAYPLIVIAERRPPDASHEALTHTMKDMDEANALAQTMKRCAAPVVLTALHSEGWTLQSPEVLRLLDKIRNAGRPLGEVINGKFYYGIKTGFNEAFVIDEAKRAELIAQDPKSEEIIKPFLRGRDIKRWHAEWAGLYLIFTRRGIDIDKYRAVKKHLESMKKRLTPGIPGGRKPGTYKWYEIQDSIDYYEEFEKPKIVYQEIAQSQAFAYVDGPFFLNNKCFFIPTEDLCLLAILNSRVAWWYLGNVVTRMLHGALALQGIYLSKLPIPEIPSLTANKLSAIAAERRARTDQESESQKLETKLDGLICELYGLTVDEARLIAPEGGMN
jgi:hypothetical protein